MTDIKITKEQGLIKSVELIGHANYNTHGPDIVCAAISMATQMTIIGLRDIARAKFDCDTETPGFMFISVHDPDDPQVTVLMDTLVTTLKALSSQYPENLTVYSH